MARDSREAVTDRRRRLRAGLLVSLTFVSAVFLAVWMLERMQLLDVEAWWAHRLANTPVIGPAIDTYRIGTAREAELAARQATLDAREAELASEEDRLEQERAELAAEWGLLETARAELESLRAEAEKAQADLAALQERLAEEARLFEVVAAMDADEAVQIVQLFDDPQIVRLIEFLPDRRAAELLSQLDPARIARLTDASSR